MRTLNEMKKIINNGELDTRLSQLYCRSGKQLLPYRERLIRTIDGYIKTFGKQGYSEMFGMAENRPAMLFSAPGRTELGGNHTDHQHGKVLTASIDTDAVACAALNSTNEINIYSEGYGMTSLSLNDNAPNASEFNTTKALIRGVACEAEKLGYKISGFDAYVLSDVPCGSGLSSSACFEILMGVIINDFFCDGMMDAATIAKIGQRAENIYFGKPSGLLDQMGCSVGGTIAVDFKNGVEFSGVDFSFTKAGYAMVTIDSGANHADLTHEYAAITEDLKRVCALFGKQVLCDVNEDDFYRHFSDVRKKVGDRATLRAMHVFEENTRVDAQLMALRTGDIDKFFELVRRSGVSSWTLLQNVTPAGAVNSQPVAVALAVTEKILAGRGACRIHGGGFGGAVQAFVPIDSLDGFVQRVEKILGSGVCHVTYIRQIGGTAIIK